MIAIPWLGVLAVAAFQGTGKEPPPAKERPGPNLLVILVDECNFRALGCYGGKIAGTPRIDRIAREGVRCTRFYATTPVCSPSRAAFFTGRYPQHTGVPSNNAPLRNGLSTFASILESRGWATGYAGKWHLDGPARPGWAPSRKFGFSDNRYMFNRGHWKKLEEDAKGPRVAARGRGGRPSYAVAGADERSYTTDFLTTRALRFIREHRNEAFCFVLSLPDPHGPDTVRAPYDRMFAETKIPLPPTFETKGGEAPLWARPAPRLSPRRLRTLLRQYYGMLRCIDDNVGRIQDLLDELGLREDTILVFTADHGDLCGEHHRLNKGNPLEGSARIPFLLRWPARVPKGRTVSVNLASVDWLPTLCGLLGMEAPEGLDGRDASRWFLGRTTENFAKAWKDRVFLRGVERGPWLCVVQGDLKLVLDPRERPWLFDLARDPWERRNLFEDPAYEDRIPPLLTALRAYAREERDPYAKTPGIARWLAKPGKKGGGEGTGPRRGRGEPSPRKEPLNARGVRRRP